jgi:hypothetical protein
MPPKSYWRRRVSGVRGYYLMLCTARLDRAVNRRPASIARYTVKGECLTATARHEAMRTLQKLTQATRARLHRPPLAIFAATMASLATHQAGASASLKFDAASACKELKLPEFKPSVTLNIQFPAGDSVNGQVRVHRPTAVVRARKALPARPRYRNRPSYRIAPSDCSPS